jgi:hypothetical protein
VFLAQQEHRVVAVVVLVPALLNLRFQVLQQLLQLALVWVAMAEVAAAVVHQEAAVVVEQVLLVLVAQFYFTTKKDKKWLIMQL